MPILAVRAANGHGSADRSIGLFIAFANGEPAERLKGKLKELERQRLELEHELATADALPRSIPISRRSIVARSRNYTTP